MKRIYKIQIKQPEYKKFKFFILLSVFIMITAFSSVLITGLLIKIIY